MHQFYNEYYGGYFLLNLYKFVLALFLFLFLFFEQGSRGGLGEIQLFY